MKTINLWSVRIAGMTEGLFDVDGTEVVFNSREVSIQLDEAVVNEYLADRPSIEMFRLLLNEQEDSAGFEIYHIRKWTYSKTRKAILSLGNSVTRRIEPIKE
ncbi:hypothetical protein BSK59_32930 [Paenibacillus odorifer]|uniref:hypothetical protein n=1 Tax=Paenibacillus odorifer TaxID=189426 RepID=UPI00096D432A|nr:hypothetical protein [Paenibacillus odorifer]OME45308.1 hypothetical protein BSK59_32930 [Paenibacillus odorifer]